MWNYYKTYIFFVHTLGALYAVCVSVKLLWIVKTNYLFRNWMRLEKFRGEKSHSHIPHSAYTDTHIKKKKIWKTERVREIRAYVYEFYLLDMDELKAPSSSLRFHAKRFANSFLFFSFFFFSHCNASLLLLLLEKLKLLGESRTKWRKVATVSLTHETI